MFVLKTMSKCKGQITVNDVLSDVNFQNNRPNPLNDFLEITETTEHGDVEADQQDIRSSFY